MILWCVCFSKEILKKVARKKNCALLSLPEEGGLISLCWVKELWGSLPTLLQWEIKEPRSLPLQGRLRRRCPDANQQHHLNYLSHLHDRKKQGKEAIHVSALFTFESCLSNAQRLEVSWGKNFLSVYSQQMCSSQIQIQHNVKISKCESRLYFQRSSWKKIKKNTGTRAK